MDKMPNKPILTAERNDVLSGQKPFFLCQCMFLVRVRRPLFHDRISTICHFNRV